jgi:hypothetical protein|tara:strand:+ start:52 stop:321 length:270 start_codon:yes stop_codon:yes gene_type:complete
MAKSKQAKDLDQWTGEEWGTKSGKPSTQGPDATGERYKPKADHADDSPQQTAAETRTKRSAGKRGEQYAKYKKPAKRQKIKSAMKSRKA